MLYLKLLHCCSYGSLSWSRILAFSQTPFAIPIRRGHPSGARILVISSLDSLPAGEEIQRQSKDADTSTDRLDLQAVARLTVFLPPVRTIARPCIKTIGSLGFKSTTNRNSHRLSSSIAYPRTRRIPWKEGTAFPLTFDQGIDRSTYSTSRFWVLGFPSAS